MHQSPLIVAIIVFVVIALFVGPVMLARPSPRDRQLERLRRCAASRGIRVELVSLPPEARGLQDDLPVARYRLAPPKGAVVPAAPALLRRHPERGFELLRPLTIAGEALAADLAEELLALPETVQVVELDERGAAVYWRERGDEARITALAGQLERIFGIWLQSGRMQ